MPNQDQLTVVASAFQQWRDARPHRNARTPETLRQQAVALLTHYSSSKITSALKLSGANVRNRSQQAQTSKESV